MERVIRYPKQGFTSEPFNKVRLFGISLITGGTNMTERNYLRIMKRLLDEGDYREGRNGGVYSLFGEQMRFDLRDGFPLLTTKRVHFNSVVVELLWMLRGDTNVAWMKREGVTIWDEWSDSDGELGPVYGAQWRSWIKSVNMGNVEIDQIAQVIKSLRDDPYGRRHIVTAWNPADIPDMALPPCHMMFQFHVSNGRLNCQLYQRSADWFLGVPFNIASYALLTHLIAREVGLEPGEFIHTFGDLHLYANHTEAARLQLWREPRDLPILCYPGSGHTLDKWDGIFNVRPKQVWVDAYDSYPTIKAEVSA
jgi:thymidylate synthase